MLTGPIRKIAWPGGDYAKLDEFLSREWLVTNGLGGYASGTVAGIPTRRYHGFLIAALKPPFGRTVMLNNLFQRIVFPDNSIVNICGSEQGETLVDIVPSEFRLEMRYAVWTYEVRDAVLERRIFMSYRQNTVHIIYRLLSGGEGLKLQLSPALHFRHHESQVSDELHSPYTVIMKPEGLEVSGSSGLPPLRLKSSGKNTDFVLHSRDFSDIYYRAEDRRGYEAYGKLWSPGYYQFDLKRHGALSFLASTESWDIIRALSPSEAYETEWERRRLLLSRAVPAAQQEIAQEAVLAADQFVFSPTSRPEDTARALAAGEEFRSVIAGYHWFTDWGRDTMISLEGLTLLTGRTVAASWILQTFSHYIRNGLVPNMFPENEREGLYNTADATLWFFHAIDRYLHYKNDRPLLDLMIPRLIDILDHHISGTDFGIGMDRADGLLKQGAEGLQLTWMDAKVEGWVVTPRRGKAVEINALWYNALRLLERWLRERGDEEAAKRPSQIAKQVFESFNKRFWCQERGYLYDVVDGEGGDDPSCRPNQLFAISLPHPVLDPKHWKAVLEVVEKKLLTPVGLRSLAPDDPKFKPRYDGDLRSRDAAYHQGTVWGWLIGPFVDAWIRLHPENPRDGRRFLEGLVPQLSEACIGSLSEVFDAEPPFTPRGCIAQAWSVAEFLRAWIKTE